MTNRRRARNSGREFSASPTLIGTYFAHFGTDYPYFSTKSVKIKLKTILYA